MALANFCFPPNHAALVRLQAAVLLVTSILSGVLYTLVTWTGIPALFGLQSDFENCFVGPDMVSTGVPSSGCEWL